MEHLEGSLVSLNPEHFLELDSAHSRSEACHKKGSPEPSVVRLFTPVHDCPGCEARVPLTVATTIDGGACSKGVGRPHVIFMLITVGADEAIRVSVSTINDVLLFTLFDGDVGKEEVIGYRFIKSGRSISRECDGFCNPHFF